MKLTVPGEEELPISQTSAEAINIVNHTICDVCGKPRSKPGGHPKCAKKRQAYYAKQRGQ